MNNLLLLLFSPALIALIVIGFIYAKEDAFTFRSDIQKEKGSTDPIPELIFHKNIF